jgi:hypothetical protein
MKGRTSGGRLMEYPPPAKERPWLKSQRQPRAQKEKPMPTLPSSRLELTQLLEEIGSFLRRFVVFTAFEQVDALALWVFHSHAVDAADVSPYVIVDSPEKQCGKSRLLDVTALLVRHAWRIDAIPSEAVLFRKIARDAPTVLLDEADAVFGAARERTEPVRALLNSGEHLRARDRRIRRRRED